MQCFVDFSITETSIHFLPHSLLVLPDPYATLHSEVLSQTKAFLQSLPIDLNSLPEALDLDARLVARVFLPCTHRQVLQLHSHHEVLHWHEHFKAKFFSPWERVSSRLREDLVEQHLNSPFGCEVFELHPSLTAKEDTRAFIEYLLADDAGNLVRMNRFNELKQVMMEELNPTLEDEELEYCAGRVGRTLEAAQSQSKWTSLCYDLTEQDLYSLYAEQQDSLDS